MNIALGKIGKTISFDSNKWGAIGGDNEAPTLFLKIADLHPNNMYYIIGKSNFRKMPDDFKRQHKNIVDIWDGYDSKTDPDYTSWPWRRIQQLNVSIDFGLFYSGPTCAGTNMEGQQWFKNKKGELSKPLMMFSHYAGPVIHFLNASRIKYFMLTVDARYNPLDASDLFNRPVRILSQYDEKNTATFFQEYDQTKSVSVVEDTVYADIEKVVLINKKRFDLNSLEKTHTMSIVLNEGGGGGTKSRYPILKEYVLDNFTDVEIYGKWNDKFYSDARFKGPKKFNELEDLLRHVKYTFIVPIQTGWTTAKYWEMANFGIIPFMHSSYDMQHHIDCPDYIRVSTPQEFLDKIVELEQNPDKYNDLINRIHNMLSDDYYDGTLVSKRIDEHMAEFISLEQ